MSGAQNGRLKALIESALGQPAYPAAYMAVDAIRATHGPSVRAVLFYGSCRRSMRPDGVLDFYVLVDGYRGYHSSMIRSEVIFPIRIDIFFDTKINEIIFVHCKLIDFQMNFAIRSFLSKTI